MNLLILQHARVEHPGIFRNFFKEDGFRTHTVELDEGEVYTAGKFRQSFADGGLARAGAARDTDQKWPRRLGLQERLVHRYSTITRRGACNYTRVPGRLYL